MKQVKLGLIWGIKQYQVKTITNSTRYKPGEWISVAEVDRINSDPNWDVSIADDQTFQAILGFVANHAPVPAIP
jgi:hypothetical protein